MFVGWRDAVFARGRFVLIGVTVALMTLLLVMLTGLTGGLGQQNTDALERLGADRFVFAPAEAGDKASFTDSAVTAAVADEWSGAVGAGVIAPLGVSTGKVSGQGAASMSVLGVPAGSGVVERAVPVVEGRSPADGELALPESVASEIGAGVGDTVEFSGAELTVAGITGDTFYSHTPAGWVTTATWQGLTHQRVVEGPDAVVGTALVVTGGSLADEAALAEATGTQVTDTRGAFAALLAYSSENRSLTMMQGFLYVISALVVVSFLTVWTIQRTRDIAVMRALGASRAFVARDALAQAALILAAGAVLGALAGWALGALAAAVVPFQLTSLTVAGPSLGVWILGMGGALIALRRVITVDPVLALGGN